jgi:shikimate dehydrogenase
VSETVARSLNAETRFCAVFGHPVRHSASPEMQNAGLSALGLDWRYVAFEVHPDDLRDAIRGARVMKFIGVNLTVPHKLLAVEMVDLLDESARMWGAVNTIRFEARARDGGWKPLRCFAGPVPEEIRSHGFNTDASGLSRALREDLGMELAGKRVIVLGAGGAGRVATLKLAAENVSHLFLINRTAARAEALAEELRERFPQVAVAVGYPRDAVDLVLNATSLGLKPEDGSPLDETLFPLRQAKAVYDMIYRPAETSLLRAAKTAGCRVANGAAMLLYQGTEALEIWTGRNAPVEVMRQALLKNIYGN